MRKWFNLAKRALCLSVTVLLLLLVYGSVTVPDKVLRVEQEPNRRSIYTLTPMTVAAADRLPTQTEYNAMVKLFRVFPVKRAKLTVTKRPQVVPGGDIFGLRLYTSGVIVISMEPVKTAQGSVFPAKDAGVRTGDIILRVNDEAVYSHTQFSTLLTDAQGDTLSLTVLRGGEQKELTFQAAYSEIYQRYMAGLWVRDSAAGIGTMTFYLPQSGVYAGLGHAVCDVDTGERMPLYNGDIVSAQIHGCKKGTGGQAGELRGSFSGQRRGSLLANADDGVYGVLDTCDQTAQTVPVALPDEVHEGAAQMISTVDGSGPQTFQVEIEKRMPRDNEGRNLIIHVTDERLLAVTGGIVQGMSGSPLLQNGALVGAVTHVFINDPARGYAIFADTMVRNCLSLETAP